jgi:hypothetical protein
MPDELPIPDPAAQENGDSTRRIIALVFALLVASFAYFLVRSPSRSSAPPSGAAPAQHPTLGPEERAYLASVGVDHLEVSRAENFLHQEVTTISGQVSNGGGRPLAAVELTLDFFDEANQVTQREVRTLFGPPGPPIPAGDHREFEVSFEHISAMWNMRPPAVRVTAVELSNGK